MKIAIVNAVYPPEPVVSAQLGRDLAEFFVGSGENISVLCPSPTRPTVGDYSELKADREPLIMDEDGIAVVRLPSFTAPQSKLFSRMRESYSFGIHACRYLQKNLADVDVIYVNSWPLLSQAFIARYCKKNGIPMVLHIQDVYPESLTNKLPMILRKVVGGLLLQLDRWTAATAAHIITISENMRGTYVGNRGIAADKVVRVLNWVDEDPYAVLPERARSCSLYDIDPDKFTFLFLGNIGPVACVDLLIDAFDSAGLEAAQLIIAGDGSVKQQCVERARGLKNRDIHFISDPDINNSPKILSLAHVFLLPMKRGAGISSIPSKLMAYLFSGRPVLASVDAGCDTAVCIEDGNCGWVGEPENVEGLARKMTEIEALPLDQLSAMGERGRVYGLKNFSKSQGVKQVSEIIMNAAGGR